MFAISRHVWMVVGLIATVLLSQVGCPQDNKPAGSPVERAWETPPVADSGGASRDPSSAATQTPAVVREDPLVAIVNGEGVTREGLLDLLIESHGLAALEQLIVLTSAKQRAASLNLTVSAADVNNAHDEALRRIAAPIVDPEAPPLDRATAEKLLNDFLQAKNLSKAEWKLRMEQRAYIRKIAQAEVDRTEITQEMLQNEYKLVYGERVQIRHIQLAGQDAMRRALDQLKDPARFEQVAKEMSENPLTARSGGLMPAFSRHDGAVPPAIREKAFAMQPGEVSEPIKDADSTWYHIIRVEKKFPASSVAFENVDQNKLRTRLKDRLVADRELVIENELFQTARVDIRDEVLRRQFRERHKR